jgi:ABC-type branched-subunit amino acid transport system substrate-binding protein
VSRFRWLVIAMVVGLVSLGTSAVAVAQSSGGGANKATEVGVSPTTIRIAVVADVDNPLQPGLFAGSVAGVQAAARYINANGGVAGRKLAVDFIDSHLSDSEAVNAIIKACSQDFALVGTSALFLNNVNDITGCKDMTGAATGIPDLPVVTTEVVQQCDPDSFPINPPQIHCDTQSAHPQTYTVNAGRANYFQSKFGKNLHGMYMYTADLQSAKSANQVTATGVQKLGIKPDDQISISATAPQDAYTPAAQSMKSKSSNFAEVELAYSQTVDLRKEAALQGVTDPSIVWSCTVQCYNPQFLTQGGTSVENEWISLGFLPDIEAKYNKAVAGFDKYTDPSKRDGFAADAFASGLLLRDAIRDVVAKDGNNGLTRKNLFTELNTIHAFTADGMLGTTDIAGRVPSPCYMLTQVKNGKFVRVYPTKPGTLDCSKKNDITFTLDVPD